MTTEGDYSLTPDSPILTERHAVYRCYSDQGVLLYIGTTGQLGKRLAAHAQKAWFVQVRGITLEWYPDEFEALNAERRAIHVEHPKFNIVHRQARRLQATTKRRKPVRQPRPRVSGAETEARALEILKAEPDISGGELGRRLERTTRYGCILKNKLAASVAGPETGI